MRGKAWGVGGRPGEESREGRRGVRVWERDAIPNVFNLRTVEFCIDWEIN